MGPQSRGMAFHLLGLFLILSITSVLSQVSTTAKPRRKVTIPPLIVSEPSKVMAFREGESIEMPCVATGEPQPMYKWHYNEKPFDPSGADGRIAIQPGVGTLIFARPIEKDEGIYQCFAENQVGISLTVKVDLRQAILEPFQPSPVQVTYPMLGHHATLKCTPPRSFPAPDIFWAVISEGERFEPIDLTDRITIDPIGNLHIVQVLEEDAKGDRQYACIVQNKVMRSIQQGEYKIVRPSGETIQRKAPEILWQSPTHQVALRNDIWRIKCIFAGSPPPRLDWARLGKPMPTRSRQESFGQELVIENVQFEDSGKYECQGINDETNVPIRRSFDLSIESAPYWIQRPESVDAAEFDKAEFHCETAGIPSPTYFWFLNGIPIEQVPSDPRRIVEKNKITFMNMSKSDAQVVQCNSTNKHGYIFANAYLNVLSEPPFILDPPKMAQKAAEGQDTVLTCRVFGSPKPLVVWKKGSEQLTGGKFKVLEDGHLEIQDVSLVDAGVYTCSASNKFDTVSASGTLIVRRKTLIQTAPLDVMVYEGTEAKFTCTATTDPEEVGSLRIDWKKDGQIIDYTLAQRVFKNDMDNSLAISGTISLDTGKYTCVASNGLDEDEASAQLVVQGPPDPPNNVQVLCTNNDKQAEVSWQPGKENYAPILNFIIQFNTTFNPDSWVDIASNVSQNDRLKRVTLSPWGNYTFRVLARNKIGISPPSLHTVDVCTTEQGRPEKNPDNVIGEGDLPNNLVIYWTPMPKLEWNSPSLYYIISWKRADISNAKEEVARVDRPEYYNYVVPDEQPTYKPYDIYVKAANSIGEATVPVESIKGYSGEDTPNEAPREVNIEDGSVTSTSVILTWDQVDQSPDSIRGFFRGYRVQFWKTDDPESLQEQDFIFNHPKYYPRPRQRRQLPPVVTAKLIHMPPFSEITIQVRVLNKYYAGPPSTPISFRTTEGEPGPPAAFEVINRGSTHFEMRWDTPIEPNGNLVGYNISYQTITGLNLGRLQYREPISDPRVIRARLTGLHPDTYYRVFLSAATKVGKGEPIFLDMRTTHAGPPSPPTFDITDLGDTWVNITWEPSRTGNPGSVFYIQYRPRGMFSWMHTSDEDLRFHMYVDPLDPGTTYQLRVVSKNGAKSEAPGEWQEFTTGGLAPGSFDLGASPWFYGIFIALLLIIILLVVFIFAKKKTDENWTKKEEEIEQRLATMAQEEEEARSQYAFKNQAMGSRDLAARQAVDAFYMNKMMGTQAPPSQNYYDNEDDDDDDDGDYDDDDDYDDEDGQGPVKTPGMPPQGQYPGFANDPYAQQPHVGYAPQGPYQQQQQQQPQYYPGAGRGAGARPITPTEDVPPSMTLAGSGQKDQGSSFV